MEKYNHIIKKITNALFLEGGELEQASYRWVLKTCRTERAASMKVIDFGFDISSFGRIESGLIDTRIFETIQDFLDYPTGYSLPTYTSGSGMMAETWENRFIDYVRDYVWDWIAQSDFQHEIKDENGDIYDDFFDAICGSEVDEYGFSGRFGEKPFPVLRLIRAHACEL